MARDTTERSARTNILCATPYPSSGKHCQPNKTTIYRLISDYDRTNYTAWQTCLNLSTLAKTVRDNEFKSEPNTIKGCAYNARISGEARSAESGGQRPRT